MGNAWIKHGNEIAWREWKRNPKRLPDGSLERTIRTKFVSDQSRGPWFFFAEWGPGQFSQAHSHSVDEVIYVLEGSIMVGHDKRNCGPGTVLYVEKDTPYGPLQAGPQGVKFINIRNGHATGMSPTSK